MCLTVHRNSVWIRNQLYVTFVLSFIYTLRVTQHVSGNHLPTHNILNNHTQPTHTRFTINQTNIEHIDPHRHIWIIPLIVTAQYQYVAITLRSRQLVKTGTLLPETCWATRKGEIKNDTKVTSSWFLIHTEYRSNFILLRYVFVGILTNIN